MRIQYQEHDLDEVIRFFADAFKPKEGEKLVVREWIIDTHKRSVVFKIYIEDKVKIENYTTQP